MKIGDKIIWVKGAPGEISAGVVTRVSTYAVWVDGEHQPSDLIFKQNAFLNTEEARVVLRQSIDMPLRHSAERAELQAKFNELRKAQNA